MSTNKQHFRKTLSLCRLEKGVSLLEILLVVALIVSLAGLSVPIYQSFQIKNDLDIAANTIAQGVRRAQVLSLASKEDSRWGVYVTTGSITIFKGDDYATRDGDFDEVFEMPETITPSGLQEINFYKLSGDVETPGTVTLSTTNQTQDLVINEKGMVEF